MMRASYVPWLHMHQPLVWWKFGKEEKMIGNLEKMFLSNDSDEMWNAGLMFRAYSNPAKYVRLLKKDGYEPKIMLDFSGLLLESLDNFNKEVNVEGEKISRVIQNLKEVMTKFPENIEIAGTAYSHCYFPATPVEDWSYQIEEWRNVFKKLFGNRCLERVKGFWLPEMGVPGFEDRLASLTKAIGEFYDWCILPLEAVEGYEQLSYEKRIQIACEPHSIRYSGSSLPVIFRFPPDVIDQQAGCEANLLYKKSLEAANIFKKVSSKPALIVPASDGENGNVMMNEFFPQTFVPFFQRKMDDKISSMTVSEFLKSFYVSGGEIIPRNDIKLKTVGASWLGGHKSWFEGTKRQEMEDKIHELSRKFHELEMNFEDRAQEKEISDLRKLLLISETSCYVFWNVDFWFNQGEKTMALLERKIQLLNAKKKQF
jgi:hypothetical protein